MKRIYTLLLTLTLPFAACSKKDEPRPATEQKRASSAEGHQQKKAANVLKIEESMLRDLKIRTAPVEERSEGESTAILGELRVNENSYAEVGAPISSRVIHLSAAAGDLITRGQTLAVLQSPEVGKAKSDVMSAETRLDLARLVLERKKRLGTERIVAQRDVQEAEASVANAEAESRSAKATLQSLGISATDSEALSNGSPQFALKSPISGTIIERAVVQGQMAEPAKPLFRVGDLSRLWLTVHAFERDAVRVRSGTTARVVFPALPGQTFTGKVSFVARQVDLDSRTVLVRIELPNKGGQLRPGMSATAWLPIANGGSGKILSVPVAALQRVTNKWVVFIPHGEDTFEIRSVARGRDLGGEVEILSGLKPSETVVVDGAFLLKAQAERSSGEGDEHDEH